MFLTIGRMRPNDANAETFKLPGPGLYAMDFRVPSWALPEFDNTRDVTFRLGRHTFTHVESKYSNTTGTLTVIGRVQYAGTAIAQSPGIEAFGIDDLAMASIVRGLAVILGAWVAAHLLEALAGALTEVRRLIQVGPVFWAASAAVVILLVPRAVRAVKGAVT